MKLILINIVAALFFASAMTLEAAPVAVRFPEGSVQAYLILRGPKGEELAIGDLQQQAREEGIHSRLVFRFKDGSLYDETVVFSQRKTFAMRQYRLIQRGPSFPTALEASIEGETGGYKVTAREEGEKEETFEGQLALPPDVANGMLAVLLKNLPQGATRTVHIVAFRPKPLLVELELAPEGRARFSVGEAQRQALHYRLRPKLGVLGVVASLIGKDVPDYHYWILGGGAPAFLAFEGPLYVDGPVWRVELVSPRWPK